jgi:hypothetical protein
MTDSRARLWRRLFLAVLAVLGFALPMKSFAQEKAERTIDEIKVEAVKRARPACTR